MTLSFPISSSWTNDTLEFKEIPKGASPWLKTQNLWQTEGKSTIYAWGGDPPYGNTTDSGNVYLWALEPDGSGGGRWEIQNPGNPSSSDIYRATRSASTSCHGIGYSLNGYGNEITDARLPVPDTALKGLITYDMESAVMSNESSDARGFVSWGGRATCVPDIGPKGLLVFLGGSRNPRPGPQDDNIPVSFSNITMYNPETKQYHWQIASGNPPDGRLDHCTVGVPGPNGTFEMSVI